MAKLESTPFSLRDGRKIIFRSLCAADAIEFLKFRAQVPSESTHTMQYIGMELPSIEDTAKRLASQQEEQVTINIGAFDDEKVIGYLNLRMPNADHPWVQHLGQFGMMILKDYWDQGLGRQFLLLQEQHAKKHGISRIEAMVRTKNERGLKLYESSGFDIEGTRKCAAKINGETVDEYFIAKMLEVPVVSWRPPTLKTSRLILRGIERNDAESIFAYAQNSNVSKYTLWEPHLTLQDSLDYINGYVFDYYSEKVPEPFAVTLKDNPEIVIGTVGCFWISKKAKSMELAYAVAEKYWGQGLVAEASREVMKYCFEEFDLKRIQAQCKIENAASAKVMEKIGMLYEGTARSALFHREKYWDMKTCAKVQK